MKIEIKDNKIIIDDTYIVEDKKIETIIPPHRYGDIESSPGRTRAYIYGDTTFDAIEVFGSIFEQIKETDFRLTLITPSQSIVVWRGEYAKETEE
jgi:hypothetical protein